MSEEIKKYPEPVVGVLIYNDKGEIFLIKNPKWNGIWTIPGGHIELTEPAAETVVREVQEETGLAIKTIEAIGFSEDTQAVIHDQPRHFIFLNYLAELAGGEETMSDEMTEYLWIDPEKISELAIKDSIMPLIIAYLEKKKADGETWEHKYKRALADYQNLLKQTAKDREDFLKYALDDFLQNILPIYDHLKLSLSGLSEEESKNPWAQGVQHVLKQFKEILTQHGIEEIKTMGEKFDHNTMEALDGSGETVKQEVMPGYTLNGKLVRPAKVIVE